MFSGFCVATLCLVGLGYHHQFVSLINGTWLQANAISFPHPITLGCRNRHLYHLSRAFCGENLLLCYISPICLLAAAKGLVNFCRGVWIKDGIKPMQCVPSFPVALGVLIVKLGTCIIFFLGPAFCCEKPPPGCYSNILFWGSTFVGTLISQSNSAPGCVNVGRLRKFWRLVTPKDGFKPMQLACKTGHLYHPFPWALCCENLLGCLNTKA